jgi:hypothetical protein
MFDEPSSYLDVRQRLRAARTIRSLLQPSTCATTTAAAAAATTTSLRLAADGFRSLVAFASHACRLLLFAGVVCLLLVVGCCCCWLLLLLLL